jgi:hypothetical protein
MEKIFMNQSLIDNKQQTTNNKTHNMYIYLHVSSSSSFTMFVNLSLSASPMPDLIPLMVKKIICV